jgi:hypothetical protein
MERIRGNFLLPEVATIKDLQKILFWCKGYEIEGEYFDEDKIPDGFEIGHGLAFKFYVKTEYFDNMEAEIRKAGGIIFDLEEMESPMESFAFYAPTLNGVRELKAW